MASNISVGGLERIFQHLENNQEYSEQPVLQCVQVKPLQPQADGTDRFRVVLSDTVNFIQSVLNTKENHLITSDKLKKGSIIKLLQFQGSSVKNKRILVLLGLEVLEDLGVHEKIGDPKPFEATEDSNKPATISSNGFYGESKPAVGGSSGALPSRTTSTTRTGAQHGNLSPIESLSPYAHKWTIKVRCSSKSEIKTWHNQRGEGKLFSATFLDESGEIRATMFNEQCDSLYDVIKDTGVYYISSPCKVQIAKRQFSNVNNDYELVFERDTLVEVADDQDNAPRVRYTFTSIGELQNVENASVIDVLAVLKDVQDVSEITSKTTSKPYSKRDLTVVDDSGFSVKLTIWGNAALSFDTAPDSVLAFKGVKVSDFGGRSLSLLSSGSMTINPDIDEAHKLKGWYDAQGRSDTFTSHASMPGAAGGMGGRADNFKNIGQVGEENIGTSGEAEYFSMKCTVVYIKADNFYYRACPTEGCNKKVSELDGQWRCERCNQSYANPQYRYMMSLNVSDHTGQMWLSSFDDVGQIIMGAPASEMAELEESDSAATKERFNDALCRTWLLRCRAKMDTYQDQQNIRYQIMSASKLSFPSECAKLSELIKSYDIS